MARLEIATGPPQKRQLHPFRHRFRKTARKRAMRDRRLPCGQISAIKRPVSRQPSSKYRPVGSAEGKSITSVFWEARDGSGSCFYDAILFYFCKTHLRLCASEILAFPEAVRGPVDRPPCSRHRSFLIVAGGFRHNLPLRVRAPQRLPRWMRHIILATAP